MLALAIIIFAIYCLWALSNIRTPNPRVVSYYGELQSAELIHVARLYWSNPSLGMDFLISKLYEFNETLRLQMNPVNYELDQSLTVNGGFYKTLYSNDVSFFAEWRYNRIGSYVKNIPGEGPVIFYNYSLFYYHNYTAPQWGNFILYPMLCDPNKYADLTYRGEGWWYIGIPADFDQYVLLDEFSIKVVIKNG